MQSEKDVQMPRPRHERHRRAGASAPRWVKLSAVIGGGFALLLFVMTILGHGPGRHIPGGDTPEHAPAEHASTRGNGR